MSQDTIHLLRLDEAAAIAKLSEKTLRRGMADPQNPLRVHRFGRIIRIDRADLDAWLRAHAAVPEAVAGPRAQGDLAGCPAAS